MATLAGLRQAGLYVIGVSCALIVLEVAGHARSHSQVEVAVYMALRARGGDVHAGQREAGLAVIEGGIGPRSRVVAGGAGGGDSGLRVIGVGCALKILHVAGSTVGWSSGKLSVHVALGTGHGGVGAGQGKLGKGVVIESRRLPRGGGVAALAGLRAIPPAHDSGLSSSGNREDGSLRKLRACPRTCLRRGTRCNPGKCALR